MQEEPMVALLRRLLPRRIGPGVYPLGHSKSYRRAVHRVTLDVLPLASSSDIGKTTNQKMSRKFPWIFLGCAVAAVVLVIVINNLVYDIRPGNSQLECGNGCANNALPEACERFCNCIYNEGNPLDKCLDEYGKRKE
jgi:hypothetical protein